MRRSRSCRRWDADARAPEASAVVWIIGGPVKRLARPLTLAEIKADSAFASCPVRISRLSVMPVTDEEWPRIEKMAAGSGAPRKSARS